MYKSKYKKEEFLLKFETIAFYVFEQEAVSTVSVTAVSVELRRGAGT